MEGSLHCGQEAEEPDRGDEEETEKISVYAPASNWTQDPGPTAQIQLVTQQVDFRRFGKVVLY